MKLTRNLKLVGFTIVELLIIVVVVAILATLSVVAYNGITARAAESTLKADLSQAVRQLEAYRIDNTQFPSTTTSISGGLASSLDTEYEYTSTGIGYCLTASSLKAGKSFYVSNNGPLEEGLCPNHYGLNPPPIPDHNKLAVGYYHACTLAYNDTAYCWGTNTDGQLGNGSTASSNVPVPVDVSGSLAGKRITDISAGQQHTCAVADGQVYCWGSQQFCQLGLDGCTYNTASDIVSPTPVSTTGVLAGKTVTDVSAGSSHTCVIADGSVYCWGSAYGGALGGGVNGYPQDVYMPVDSQSGSVIENETVTWIDTGNNNTCAIANSKAYCWGGNSRGQLGIGSTTGSRYPLAVDSSGVLLGKSVTKISIGSNYGSTCAMADGQAFCWGEGGRGQSGNGDTTDKTLPVAVDTSGVLNAKTVSHITMSDYESACAVADNKAYCWGSNELYGALGDGTTVNRATPVAVNDTGVMSAKNIVSVEGGYYFTCALSDDDSVFCWGSNSGGKLGGGPSASNSYNPILVIEP